jgi:hypothetical protein
MNGAIYGFPYFVWSPHIAALMRATLAAFHQPLIPAEEISRKKPGCLGRALVQWLAPGSTQVLGEHRGSYHLISHVVLCGMSIAK